MVFGNKVIDQELVTGIPGAPMEAAASSMSLRKETDQPAADGESESVLAT